MRVVSRGGKREDARIKELLQEGEDACARVELGSTMYEGGRERT